MAVLTFFNAKAGFKRQKKKSGKLASCNKVLFALPPGVAWGSKSGLQSLQSLKTSGLTGQTQIKRNCCAAAVTSSQKRQTQLDSEV